LGMLAESLLVPVFSFYFLVDWPNLVRRFDHMVPPRRRREVREIARDLDAVVAGWVRGQAIVTTILAVLYAIGLTFVGRSLSLTIGLFVGVLTVSPFTESFVCASSALMGTRSIRSCIDTLGIVAGVNLCLPLVDSLGHRWKIRGYRCGFSETGGLLAVVAG